MDGMSQQTSSQPTILTPGTIIDERYEVLSMLRHSSAGVVYAARGVLVEEPVTLTILSDGKGCSLPRCVERDFLRSAQAASEFDHPNVITIRDFGFADTSRRCYLVRNKLVGTTLAQEIRDNGAIAADRLLDLLIPCVDALAEGHDTGLMHGHLSPASIWLAHPGELREALRLIDFGVPCVDVCACSDPDSQPDAVAYPCGVPGDLCQSAAADAYQMALVMLEAITGNAIDWRVAVGVCEGLLAPIVPDEVAATALGALIVRALSPRREERFADGAALVKALISVRRGEALGCREDAAA